MNKNKKSHFKEDELFDVLKLTLTVGREPDEIKNRILIWNYIYDSPFVYVEFDKRIVSVSNIKEDSYKLMREVCKIMSFSLLEMEDDDDNEYDFDNVDIELIKSKFRIEKTIQ